MSARTLRMSLKERERMRVMSRVKEGGMKLTEAKMLLGVSYRQCKRIYRRYREEGDGGLIHRSRGRPSNCKKDSGFREAVVRRYEERYDGFGPTHACEKLVKEGYELHHDTLRRWLVAEGLWGRRRKRKHHRSWRERKAHRGEMVQMDGSPHDWFEGRGEPAVLMDMVDDATGVTFAQFHERDTRGNADVLGYIERCIPLSLYVDKDTVYVVDGRQRSRAALGRRALTQFGRAVQNLG